MFCNTCHAVAELGLMLPNFSSQAIRQSVDSSKLRGEQAKDALFPDSEPNVQTERQPASPQRSLLDFLTLRFEETGDGPAEDVDTQPGLLPRFDFSEAGLQSRWQPDVARGKSSWPGHALNSCVANGANPYLPDHALQLSMSK